LLGTRVSLLKAWRLRICQDLLLRLLLVASNGSYTVWNAYIKEIINEGRQDDNITAYEFYVRENLI
jgi:hypothetical protein